MVGRLPGIGELFSPYFGKSKALINRIMRESDYRAALAQERYMAVEIRGTRYAFRIENMRRFILMPELQFLTTMKEARVATAQQPEPAPPTNVKAWRQGNPGEIAAARPADARLAPATAPTFQANADELLGKKRGTA